MPDGPLGVDPLDRRGGQPRRLDLGDRPPVGLAKEGRLEGEVDGARRHVARQLLRLLVVLEEGHRKRAGRSRPTAPSAPAPATD